MRFTELKRVLFLVAAAAAVPPISSGQRAPSALQEFETIQSTRLPASMRERFLRLGSRMQKAEKARVVYTGALRDSRGGRPVEIVIQNPGLVRIAEGGVGARVTSFDGNRVLSSVGAISPDQQKLLETLIDGPEAIFQQLASGEAFRKIGGGHKVDGSGVAGVPLEFVDVYQLFPRGRITKAVPAATPRFIAFDSSSLVLKYVSYTTVGGTSVSSQFEDWKITGGENYPGRIRRIENGIEVFRVDLQAIQVGARLSAGQF